MSKIKYVFERIKKIKRMMRDFTDEKLNVFQKFFILFDMGISMVIYGCGINDYFQYQFYKKRHVERKNFVVHKKRMKIVNTFNDPVDRDIFDEKSKFNIVYKDFIKRDWLLMKDASFQEFEEFSNQHTKFISKVIDGSHGKGIEIIDIAEESKLNNLYNRLKKQRVIIEELIIQHDSLADFNPTSVNTLRVVTLLTKDGTAEVMTANLRVGNGEKYADNFHHNGIASLIDTNTGIVVTSGIDMNFNRYYIHPYSGKQIIGFNIPFWDEVVETCKQAALVTKTVGYVGWDVAIGKNGEIMIVEGNAAADPDISQMPDQIGKWPIYKKYM